MANEHQRRVLIVDDDADIRQLLITAFRMKNLVVDTATNGEEAVELLRAHSYCVVVLDLFMPMMDGFGVLEKIHDDAVQPVVLVVTGADRKTIEKVDARSIHGIVKKPFDVEELASVVASCAEARTM
jgi:two-component system, sensor histidine kinase and response regulator